MWHTHYTTKYNACAESLNKIYKKSMNYLLSFRPVDFFLHLHSHRTEQKSQKLKLVYAYRYSLSSVLLSGNVFVFISFICGNRLTIFYSLTEIKRWTISWWVRKVLRNAIFISWKWRKNKIFIIQALLRCPVMAIATHHIGRNNTMVKIWKYEYENLITRNCLLLHTKICVIHTFITYSFTFLYCRANDSKILWKYWIHMKIISTRMYLASS